MTFRLPFQIFRAVPIPRPPSPDRLVSPRIANTLQRNIASAAVKTTKNLTSPTNCTTKQNKSLLPRFVPSYSFQRRFKSNLENRKKVRKQHKCHERKCEQKLIFRQTTREECEKCLGPILVPDKCPKLSRLKPHYDQSKLKYDHGKCPVKCKAPRMDEVKGVQVVKKKLPKLPKGDCVKCSNSPTVAPELGRPLKLYEPAKLEQVREKCGPYDVCAPRMDDVVGLKVSHKTLPKLPVGDCEPCKNVPTILPRLAPLKPLYDASKLEQIRICKEPDCANPQRIDDIIGLKVEPKELPKLPVGDCEKCSNKPTYAPKLVRLKSKYDASKLKWLHVECKKCDVCAPRMDDVVGYKVEKKTLPKLIAKCLRCIPNPPTILPKLVRPGKMYDDTQLKWKHTECKKCDICAPRMDDVVGYKIKRKKLPALKPSEECTYCKNIPTVAPKLVRPKKQYDDTEMKWKHEKCPLVCKPPRSDIVRGYKVVPKTLKKIPVGDCKICINKPLHAPELKRLKKKYDASKLKWNHSDCYKCDICAPRMDDVMGLKIKKKHLPKLPVGDCEPCIVKPKYAPELKRLEKRYDPTKLKWKHVNCNPCKCPPRMDDIMGYKVTPKRLPKLESLECIQCKSPPSYAPELKRLKKRYDPSKLEKVRKPKPCLCDLDPPRMDDVKCWKPKKKILPAFNSKSQARHFSTFAVRRKYTPKMLQTLRKKAYNYSRRFKSKKISECCPPEPSKCDAPKQDPKCLKPCPKFKMKYCKQPDSTICREYKEKTCKKLCAPYDAYTDRMGDMYEDEMSECINWNDVLLQPKKQVSGTFYKLKPPPPKWDHIDPALERNCIACAKPCPIPRNKKPEWCNPCTEFKMKHCKPRGRKHCNDFTKKPLCKKLEAPYPSFTDYCPQFPEKELDECEVAENLKHEYMVNYYGQSMKYKKEYGNFGDCNDYCKPKCTECKATGIGMKTFPKCRQKPKDKGKCRPVKFPFRWMKCRSKVGENDD